MGYQDVECIPDRGSSAEMKSSDPKPSSSPSAVPYILLLLIFITSIALGFSYINKLEDDKKPPSVALGCFISTIVITFFAMGVCTSEDGAQLVFGIGSLVAFCCYAAAAILMIQEAKANENHRALGYAAGVFCFLNIIPMCMICYACGNKSKS